VAFLAGILIFSLLLTILIPPVVNQVGRFFGKPAAIHKAGRGDIQQPADEIQQAEAAGRDSECDPERH